MKNQMQLLIKCSPFLVLLASPLLGAEPWEADRLFWLNMDWVDNARNAQPRVNNFTADAKGEMQGKTLSKDTWAVEETADGQKMAPAGLTVYPINFKCLPTGAADQAVEWPAAGNVEPKQGAISLFVQGKAWDPATPQRETLITLDGKGGSLSIEKDQPNTLAVMVNGKAAIETPLEAPDRYHHLVLNFEADKKSGSGRLTLFLDRKPVGTKIGVALPSGYDRLVVGQLGAGPGTNKILDNIAIYRRPLAQGEITKIYYLEGKIELPHVVTVPFASKPPKIDGIFDAGEWDLAAGICGFVDESACDSYVIYNGTGKPWEVADTVRLAYDDQYLYFAYHCPPPKAIAGNAPLIAAMLKETKAGFDTDVDSDDSLYIGVLKPYPWGDVYHLTVNGMNTHYEFSDGGVAPGSVEKGRALGFNPKWITGTTLTLDGWKLEGAIPWKDLKMATPKPGEQLRLNFMRNWKTTLSGIVSWAHGTRHGPKDEAYFIPAGVIQFGAKDGAAVQLTGLGSLGQGNLDFQAKLVNPGTKAARLRVEIASNSGEIQKVQEVDVPAGGATPFEFKARATNPETGDVTFRVVDPATRATVYAAGYPLVRKDHPDVYLRKYPSSNLVKFEVDFTALSQAPAKELSAEMEVVPAAGGKPIARDTIKQFGDYSHVFEASTKGATPGRYEARFKFLHKGRLADTTVLPFEIQPRPAWYDNTIGCDDPQRPPYPFTKMEVRNDREVCVWGRSYHFDDSLLPAQIEINPNHYPPPNPYPGGGQNLLRGPMKLAGEAGGAAFSTDQLKAQWEWTEKTPTRVRGKRSVTADQLAITAEVEMEYDGYCWVKLTLAPKQGEVEVRSLAFEEPFAPRFSDVVNAGEYSLVGTGEMPKQPLVKSAVQPIWIGNGDGGLQTFLETLATFHVKDLQTTLQVVPGQAGATMRYNLIDDPLVIKKPYTIEFGFNATPVRPREWRTPREQTVGHRNSYFNWFTTSDWLPGDPGWGKTYWNGPIIGPDYSTDRGGIWHRGEPYMTLDAVPICIPDVQEFGDEWLMNPDTRWRDRIGKEGELIQVTSHAKSYRDFILGRMNDLFQTAPFAGVYYDVTGPGSSSNPYANAGILREDGTRVATASVRTLRDVTKRIYNLCRHTYPDGQIMFHDSGCPHMAYMAFCEVFFDGENLNSAINAQQPTYRGLLTPGKFRAEYMAHNFGPQLWWLGQGRIAKETVAKFGADVLEDHMAGLMLLHQAPVVFAGGFSQWHGNEPLLRTHQAVRKYELYGCGYKFWSYWNEPPVTGLKENQYASFYVHEPLPINHEYWQFYTRVETDDGLPHRAIGIFCNESDWKGELAVKVDLKKLGFKDGVKVRAINAVHSTGYRIENVGTPREKGVYFPKPEETAQLKGDELRFPMTEWNYRMIVLEEVR